MSAADWHDLIVTLCLVAVVVVVALILGFALGWFQFSASFKVTPPWQRARPEPRPRAAPVSEEQPAAIQPITRKAS